MELELWTLAPFALLLLCIAVLPLLAGHWWEHNRNKGIVVALLAVPMAAYLVIAFGDAGIANLIEKAEEYASFLILLMSLFVITGGVYVQGSLSGTPLVNTGILALGGVVANVIGTTGASVLLIRPLLRANASRPQRSHIVIFFIFIVSNCGGLLTPLGDPPLFLGYLKGVPFEWTLSLWKPWLITNVGLLVIFHVWDRVAFKRDAATDHTTSAEVLPSEPFKVQGSHNFLFLLGVVAVIYAAGAFKWSFGIQEGLMLALGLGAYASTSPNNRSKNKFSFGPIIEVAVLFAGIFVTMAPALLILNAWGKGERDVFGVAFGLDEPWQFFWATGALSGFLDNAPTYLTFAATACGMKGVPIEGQYLATLLKHGDEAVRLLAAISCGAVFMGANTYIGNGPNFMVKAIAEENGVKMPSFFGYMAYSGAVLIPLFIVVTFAVFR